MRHIRTLQGDVCRCLTSVRGEDGSEEGHSVVRPRWQGCMECVCMRILYALFVVASPVCMTAHCDGEVESVVYWELGGGSG